MRKHARGLCGIIWSEPEKKLKSDEKGRVSYTAIMHYGCVVGVADSVSNKNTTEDKSKQNGAGRPTTWWASFRRQPEAVLSVRLSQDDVGITWNLRAQDQQTDDQNGQFHLLVSLQLNNCSQQHT
jgi:hypothetical protein